MLKFNLIEETAFYVRYEYYPEGTSDTGIIFYDKQKNKCIIEKISETDPHQIYALKMMSRIRKCVKDNSFPKTGGIVWY